MERNLTFRCFVLYLCCECIDLLSRKSKFCQVLYNSKKFHRHFHSRLWKMSSSNHTHTHTTLIAVECFVKKQMILSWIIIAQLLTDGTFALLLLLFFVLLICMEKSIKSDDIPNFHTAHWEFQFSFPLILLCFFFLCFVKWIGIFFFENKL